MHQDWRDITYLQKGSPRQRAAFIAIREIQVLEELQDFDPILIGTIPIGVDVSDSDLDIACFTSNLHKFQTSIMQKFAKRENFSAVRKTIRGKEAVIAKFSYKDFAFELFGQDTPSDEQDGYVHMVLENRILMLSNENTRLKIKRLRSSGEKTELAFAKILGIDGDPYLSLLEIAKEDDETLTARLKEAGLV